MPIKPRVYNNARAALILAGSASAEKSHKKHSSGRDCPDDHGKELLYEAIADFQADSGHGSLTNGMNTEQNAVLAKVARKLGYDVEYLLADLAIV